MRVDNDTIRNPGEPMSCVLILCATFVLIPAASLLHYLGVADLQYLWLSGLLSFLL